MVEPPSILIIEDEPRLRQNLQILLHSEGYAVATAENGAEGHPEDSRRLLSTWSLPMS